MKGIQVAVRYARALFEFALERKELEPVYHDVLLLQQVCSDNKEFRLLLKSPIVQTDKKEKIIREVFAGKISALTLGFVLLLIRKRRDSFIPVIANEFIEQYQDHSNILPVRVTSAIELTDEIRRRIREIMTDYTKATVEITGSVNPDLIGGFILSWKDKQYDVSISHQIERLKRKVARVNLYVKEI